MSDSIEYDGIISLRSPATNKSPRPKFSNNTEQKGYFKIEVAERNCGKTDFREEFGQAQKFHYTVC